MTKFVEIIAMASKNLDIIARWSLVITMVVFILNIILRSVGYPLLGAYEWVGFLMVLVNGLSVAYCALQDGHVSVDLLTQKLSTAKQAYVEAIINFFSTIFLLLVSWQALLYAGSLKLTGEVSLTTEIPVYPFVYVLAIGFLLFALNYLVKLLKSLGIYKVVEVTENEKS